MNKENEMSELRTRIEVLINERKGTDYVVSEIGKSEPASSEMIAELVSVVCTLEKEKADLEENAENLALALNQIAAAYYDLRSRKSLRDRIISCFRKKAFIYKGQVIK